MSLYFLKQYLAGLLQYCQPLKLLTSDAAFVLRPLLEVMQRHHVNYVFQVKGNQPELHESVETTFAERVRENPAAEKVFERIC